MTSIAAEAISPRCLMYISKLIFEPVNICTQKGRAKQNVYETISTITCKTKKHAGNSKLYFFYSYFLIFYMLQVVYQNNKLTQTHTSFLLYLCFFCAHLTMNFNLRHSATAKHILAQCWKVAPPYHHCSTIRHCCLNIVLAVVSYVWLNQVKCVSSAFTATRTSRQ